MTRGRRELLASAALAVLLHATGLSADEPTDGVLSLLSERRYSEARSELEPLLKRDPQAARLRLIDGILSAREGRTAEAIVIFERLRHDRPDMFEPHNNLAVLYARQGRLDAARESLAAALERRPDAVAYANLGDLHMRLADRAYARARDLGGGIGATARVAGCGDQKGSARSGEPSGTGSPCPAAQAPPPPARANEGPLALVAPNGKAPIPIPSARPAADLSSTPRCLHAGRFKDRAAAAEAAEWLQSRGAELHEIRHEERRVVKSYRVYLPAASDSAAAKAKLRELRGRGIRDVAIVANGTSANRISLGLYRSAKNAKRRVAQLRKLGYPAESPANAGKIGEYAVRARIDGARSALEAAWSEKFAGDPVRYVDCP